MFFLRPPRASARQSSRRWAGGPESAVWYAVLILVGLASLCPLRAPLYAQEAERDAQLYRVETTDGQTVVGTMISETETEIILETRQRGDVTIQRSDVRHMEAMEPDRVQNGESRSENPQSTRYFFSPNAIGLSKGHGYYQNTWILFNNVDYGVYDNFSFGAGTVPLFLFGLNVYPVWIFPKLSVSTPQEGFHLAGGAVLGGVLGFDGGGGVGLVYGSSTVGTRDNNATLSVAYGYAGRRVSDIPVINLSGMTRIGRTTYLLTENYFIPGEGGSVVSLGVRYAPENFAVDFGLVRPLSAGRFIALPWLGVTLPFGR